jgi:hypothetical protein
VVCWLQGTVIGHFEAKIRCCSFLRGHYFCIENATKSVLVIHVAPKKNNYTLVEVAASAGASLGGGNASGEALWVADKLCEETSRLRIPPGGKETVPLQTRDGVYVTVCMEQTINSSCCDIIVGDKNRFMMRDSLYTLTTGQA